MMNRPIQRELLDRNVLLGPGLGLCPALAVSTTLQNGIGLGITVLLVLVLSCGILGLFKKVIAAQIRIPAAFIVIGAVVTVVSMLIKVVAPHLSDNLGIYIPLIAVNCVVLGRAQAAAFQWPLKKTLLDALATGSGYLLALIGIGALREILGRGTLLGMPALPGNPPLPMVTLPFGGLLIFALSLALLRKLASGKTRI